MSSSAQTPSLPSRDRSERGFYPPLLSACPIGAHFGLKHYRSLKRESAIDISEACMTVRECQSAFQGGREPKTAPFELELAVQAIKRHLEGLRRDHRPIEELAIDEQFLYTRIGVNYVMPFVLSAERSIQAAPIEAADPMH